MEIFSENRSSSQFTSWLRLIGFFVLGTLAFCEPSGKNPDEPTRVRPYLKLRLYIANPTFEATAAIAQVHSLLQKHGTSYCLEVLDVNDFRDQALEDGVPFSPILMRIEPLPVIRLGMPAANVAELEAALRPAPPQLFISDVA